MTFFVASERVRTLYPTHPEIGGRAGEEGPGRSVPDGPLHAVDAGADSTVCGLPLRHLTTWEHVDWPGGLGSDLCRTCESGVARQD